MGKPSPNNIKKVLKVFEEQPKNIPLNVFEAKPYEALISTVLSSRTKDETTLKACKKLFKKAPDIYSLRGLSRQTIEQLIYPVGFYKTKAKNIKNLSKVIITDFAGEIPADRKELMKLPGVGRKTANLVINRVFNKPAIAVDTHVHKISNILGWVDTKSPKETEKELMKIIPKKHWSKINRLFVSVGRNMGSKRKVKKFLKKNSLI